MDDSDCQLVMSQLKGGNGDSWEIIVSHSQIIKTERKGESSGTETGLKS